MKYLFLVIYNKLRNLTVVSLNTDRSTRAHRVGETRKVSKALKVSKN